MNSTLSVPSVHPDDAALEAAFPPVPFDSAEWDEEDDHWTPNDAVRLYSRGFDFRFFDCPDPWDESPDLIPDAPDFAITQAPGYWESLAAVGITPLPEIAGGCEPPTAAELADLERPTPNRYSPDSLIAFRRAAWGV
jgi:hypothetical protein